MVAGQITDMSRSFPKEMVLGKQEFDYVNISELLDTLRLLIGTYYIVQDEDLANYDFISWKAYQREDLWWVIMYVNDIVNPMRDLYAGMVVVIPPIESVLEILRTIAYND